MIRMGSGQLMCLGFEQNDGRSHQPQTQDPTTDQAVVHALVDDLRTTLSRHDGPAKDPEDWRFWNGYGIAFAPGALHHTGCCGPALVGGHWRSRNDERTALPQKPTSLQINRPFPSRLAPRCLHLVWHRRPENRGLATDACGLARQSKMRSSN
ncbi:hypothetical protein VTI74DRAFT_737 [Chaetomium olivicolor]